MEFDKDLRSIQEVRDIVAAAKAAQAEYAEYTQEQMDKICLAVTRACEQNLEKLAKMANEETGYGVWQDKVLKNRLGSTMTYDSFKDMKCVGILKEDKEKKLIEVGVPMGVVAALIPSTNPTSTVMYKSLICLKSGNVCILRGGKEAISSNMAIAEILRGAVVSAGLPADCIQLVSDTSRESANQMMRMSKYLDVLIPRGGAGLIRAVVENSTVPVIETGVGNCHVFVDRTADIDMAADIIFNAKTSRPSVCNAIETILVHKDIASEALPVIKARLDGKNVELRGCDRTRAILGESVVPATDEDYATEFLDYILACRVVDSLDEAIDHIAEYSTGHSECIVTSDYFSAEKFTSSVDSAAVYVNCSTRFTDGGEFGLGAEIGISTQKLHARGPMGIRQLTSSKFIIQGDGQIR